MHYREVKFGMLIFYTATDGLDAGRARCRGRVPTGESALAYSLLLYELEQRHGVRELPELGVTPGGKPYFPSRPDWHFSLSHTCGLVLAAVSDRPVGADAQVKDGRAERLTGKLMSPGERAEFDFYELWCLRESVYKLHGCGDLRTMRFSRRGGAVLAPEPGIYCRSWSLPGHALAAADFDGLLPEAPVEVPPDKICT